ncbi:MAG: class I SAM-dependent methyltransferase [Bauldia sp.]|nr:class I SAM-dependent methyltransferase [Bauldia sp.]
MTQDPAVSSFRFGKPTREDLPRLARLGYDAAIAHCGACRNYHMTAPYLRAMGTGGIGVEFAWDSQMDVLVRATAGRRTVRWLMAGAADAGMTGLVSGLAETVPGVDHHVTIVDRCQTPLILSRAHAEAEGMAVETILGDLRQFHRDRAFDVVLMHFTTIFFEDGELVPFLRHAATWLAPGGTMIAGFLHDRPSPEPSTPPAASVNEWRSAVVRAEMAAGRIDLPEDAGTFIARLERRNPTRTTRRVPVAEVAEIVRAAGLAPREIALLPFADDEAALWGADCRQRCFVVATLP